MPDTEQIQKIINDLATRVGGRMTSVSGPALVVVLTEVAKADGMDLETLLEMVASQYAVATGELFKETP